MKFLNFILLAAGAVSAISSSTKTNPYLVCERKDYKCKLEKLTECYNEKVNCIINSKVGSFIKDCGEISRFCAEILKPNASKEEPKYYVATNTFEPTKENVKILGRANYQDGYLWIGLTNTGIEYQFNGKNTTINVTADSSAYSEETPCHVIIYADGTEYLNTVITEKITDFNVSFTTSGNHVVRFMKVSEAERGSLRINEITADAQKIEPTVDAPLKIEFVGDSITAAYGVDAEATDTYSTRTQDGTKSYAYKTAQKFNADSSIVAFSGFAILSCMSFDGGRTPNSTVPPIYDKLGFSFAPNVFDDGSYELQSTNWNTNDFVPDLIVINLGTNDNTYFLTIDESKVPEETQAFIDTYEEFLAKIRSYYPKAEILCTLGVMGQELYPQIEEAVQNYTTKTGDSHVKTLKLNVQNKEANGEGADGHPSAQSQVDTANELVDAIQKLYGWQADPNVNIEL